MSDELTLAIYTAWRNARSAAYLNSLETGTLDKLMMEYGKQSVLAAITTAAQANKRDKPNLNFLAAILSKQPRLPTDGKLHPGGVI